MLPSRSEAEEDEDRQVGDIPALPSSWLSPEPRAAASPGQQRASQAESSNADPRHIEGYARQVRLTGGEGEEEEARPTEDGLDALEEEVRLTGGEGCADGDAADDARPTEDAADGGEGGPDAADDARPTEHAADGGEGDPDGDLLTGGNVQWTGGWKR